MQFQQLLQQKPRRAVELQLPIRASSVQFPSKTRSSSGATSVHAGGGSGANGFEGCTAVQLSPFVGGGPPTTIPIRSLCPFSPASPFPIEVIPRLPEREKTMC